MILEKSPLTSYERLKDEYLVITKNCLYTSKDRPEIYADGEDVDFGIFSEARNSKNAKTISKGVS